MALLTGERCKNELHHWDVVLGKGQRPVTSCDASQEYNPRFLGVSSSVASHLLALPLYLLLNCHPHSRRQCSVSCAALMPEGCLKCFLGPFTFPYTPVSSWESCASPEGMQRKGLRLRPWVCDKVPQWQLRAGAWGGGTICQISFLKEKKEKDTRLKFKRQTLKGMVVHLHHLITKLSARESSL